MPFSQRKLSHDDWPTKATVCARARARGFSHVTAATDRGDPRANTIVQLARKQLGNENELLKVSF